MSNIGADDLIYYSDNDGKVYSGGFSVNSIMVKEGLSPIMTLNSIPNTNNNNKLGIENENVSDLFSDLVIPSWSLYHPESNNIKYSNKNYNKYLLDDDYESDGYVSDDLYEKLLSCVTISEKEINGGNKKTRKTKKMKINIINKNNKNKTKRNKNN
jgi:hypothetical protein